MCVAERPCLVRDYIDRQRRLELVSGPLGPRPLEQLRTVAQMLTEIGKPLVRPVRLEQV